MKGSLNGNCCCSHDEKKCSSVAASSSFPSQPAEWNQDYFSSCAQILISFLLLRCRALTSFFGEKSEIEICFLRQFGGYFYRTTALWNDHLDANLTSQSSLTLFLYPNTQKNCFSLSLFVFGFRFRISSFAWQPTTKHSVLGRWNFDRLTYVIGMIKCKFFSIDSRYVMKRANPSEKKRSPVNHNNNEMIQLWEFATIYLFLLAIFRHQTERMNDERRHKLCLFKCSPFVREFSE